MTLTRRGFLRAGGAAVVASGLARQASAAPHRVGVGRDPDPYGATARAIDASGEWPSSRIFGRTVVVKPNLVSPLGADAGATTHTEVVRAIVDRALADGAAEVIITEASPIGALFNECGYEPFGTYDTRVRLVDLAAMPVTLAPVPSGGWAYQSIYVAGFALDPNVVFISVAKLKTHGDAVATLAVKNLFGLPAIDRYISHPTAGRFAMHDRSPLQSIVDLYRLRPIDFAVVDGIVGMEGNGPLGGTPVRMDTVLAGLNACAVDRVGIALMNIPQRSVRYLDYLSLMGLAPFDVSSIDIVGDTVAPRTFRLPTILPPLVDYPRVYPRTFNPTTGGQTQIWMWYAQTCVRKLEVLRVYEDSTTVELIRTLAAYGGRTGGVERVVWDGRGDDGAIVPPGRYAIHMRAFQTSLQGRPADAIGWAFVQS